MPNLEVFLDDFFCVCDPLWRRIMTSLLFSFFSYFSSFLNGRRNVLTDAQKRELFYDSPLTFAETLLSTTTLFRDTHTHTPAPHFSLFIKKKDSKGGDRGAMCNNSPWLPTPKTLENPQTGPLGKKTRQRVGKKAIARHSFNFLRGRSAFGVLSAPFRNFFRQSHCGRLSLHLPFFAEQLFYFLSFFPSKCIRETPFFTAEAGNPRAPNVLLHFSYSIILWLWSFYCYGTAKKGGMPPKNTFPSSHTHTYFVCLDSRTEKALSGYRDTSLRPSPPSSRQRLRASFPLSLFSPLRPSQMIPLLFS